jgi:hypothetical protein
MRLDQRRSGEASHQPEQGAGRAKAQRQPHGQRGDRRQSGKGRGRADHPVEIGRGERGGIEAADTGAGQRLRNAGVGHQNRTATGHFRAADQRCAQQHGKRDPHDGRHQPGIDGIAHQQCRRDQQREAARPDGQLATEQILEAGADRFRGRGGAGFFHRRGGEVLCLLGFGQGELFLDDDLAIAWRDIGCGLFHERCDDRLRRMPAKRHGFAAQLLFHDREALAGVMQGSRKRDKGNHQNKDHGVLHRIAFCISGY